MSPAFRLLPLCLVVAASFDRPAVGAPVQWRVEDGGNGHFYDFYASSNGRDISWDAARAAAEATSYAGVHGHLVTITSAAEQAFFSSIPRATNWTYYLGGSQSFSATKSDEGWSWVTGEPWEYTNWATLGGFRMEPSDTVGGIFPGVEDGTENYLATYPNPEGSYSMWNDIGGNSGTTYRYAVEFPVPEPSSAAVSLTLTALALLRRTRA